MSEKVKVGIIGLGFMGSVHFGIYNDNPKSEVVAVADVDEAKRRGDISKVVGNISGSDNSKPLDFSNITTYADGLDLINDPNVDLVDICVPVFLHKKYSLAAIAAGKKILCEKPLAGNSQDALEIVEAAEEADSIFMVGMCVRFWPEYRHTQALIKSGKAGKVYSATFKRLSPNIDGNAWENWFMKADLSGAAVLDLHLHDTDIVNFMFGIPKTVTSFGVRAVRSDKGIDHIVTRYDFGDGSLITAEGAWDAARATPFEMSYQIVCENMTFRFSETGYKVIHEDGTVDTPEVTDPELPTGWHQEIDYMLDCIVRGEKPTELLTLSDLVDSIRIIEAEIESVDTKRSVKIRK